MLKLLVILVILTSSCAGNRPGKGTLYKEESIGTQVGSLTEKYWKLTGLQQTAGDTFRQGEREPHIIFRPGEKRVVGSGGCNKFSGTYQVSGQGISISNLISTKMACLGVDYEDDFLNELETSDHYFISGDSLFLLNNGCISATFVLKP